MDLRFSVLLGSLIGWLAICSSLLAETQEVEARKKMIEAVAAIEKAGGTLERDPNAPGQPVVKVSLPACTCLHDEAVLAHLQYLPQLRKLDLLNDCKSSKLTDKGLAHLEKLTQLESLRLSDSAGGKGFTDAGLKHLKGLTQLRELVIGNNPGITEAGIEDLQKSLPKTSIKRK